MMVMLLKGAIVLLFALLAACNSAELPPGWTAHSWQGKTYYHNRQTGASQWEPPRGSTVVATPAATASAASVAGPAAAVTETRGAEFARVIAERDSALQAKQEALDLYAQIQARLNTTLLSRTTLQTRLDEASQENRQLQLRLTDTREQLIAAQHKVTQLSETVATLRRMAKDADANATVIELHLQQAMERIEQQERELAEAYKEIEKLDRRLRDLARSRARSNSFAGFLPRAIRRWLPLKPARPFRTALLMDEIEGRLNRTIKSLRQNNTALARALQSKTAALDEMAVRVTQSEDREKQVTKAHAALREQLDLLVAKLAERDKENEAHEAAVAALQKELAETRANQTKQAKTVEQELQAKRAVFATEHANLQQKYDQLQQTLESKDRMIDALNSTASSLQQSLMNLRHQLSATSEELVQLRQSRSPWSKLRQSRWFSWCFLGLL